MNKPINPIGFMNMKFNKSPFINWYTKLDKEKKQQVHDGRNQMQTVNTNKAKPFNFSYKHIYSKGQDLEGNLSKLKKMKKISEKGGHIYSFDIETLGDAKKHKDLLGITELALVKQSVKRNGKVDKKVIQDLKFGINPADEAKFNDLLQKASRNFKSLSATERSTVQRLAFYADPNATSRDIGKAREGLSKLTKEGREFQGELSYNDALKKRLKPYIEQINKVGDKHNELLVGYNTNNFDIDFINDFAKEIGLDESIDGSKHLDLKEPLEFGMNGKMMGVHEQMRKASGVDKPVKSGYQRLEKIMESLGIQTQSHDAIEDSHSTVDSFVTKYNDKNLLDEVLSANENKILAGDFEVNNKIIQDKIFNFNSSAKINGYDLLYENGKRVDYQTYGMNRMNFYETDGINFISQNDLPENIIKDTGANNGMFSATFRNKASHRDQEVTIFRKSKEEIFDILKSKTNAIDKKDITQEAIDKATFEYDLDKTRRRFEGMFKANDRGFDDVEKFMSALEDAKKIDPNMTQEKLAKLFNDQGQIDGSLFKSLRNPKNEFYDSQVQNFINMFDVLDDNEGLFRPIMNRINEESFVKPNGKQLKGDELKAKKTRMFDDAVTKALLTKDLSKEELFYETQNFNINHIDQLDVMKTDKPGEYHRINLSNQDSITYALYGSAKRETKQEALKVVNNKRMKRSIEKKAEDLIQRGLLDRHVLETAVKNENQNPFYLAQAIAENINNKHVKLKQSTKGNMIDLKNIDEKGALSQYHKQKIKVLKSKSSNGLSFDANEVRSITDKSIQNVKDIEVFNFFNAENDGWSDSFVNKLKNDFGYEDKHIETLNNVLYGYKEDGYGISFFEEDGILNVGLDYTDIKADGGDVKKGVNNSRMYEMLMNGEKPENMIAVRLPRMRENLTGKHIELGGIEKMNTTDFVGYINKKESGIKSIVTQEKDMMQRVIEGLRIVRDKTTQHIRNGNDYLRAQSNARRVVEGVLGDAAGYSSNKTVKRNGEIKRMILPNAKDDFASKNQISVGPLANYLPFIYEDAQNENNKALMNYLEEGFETPENTGKAELINLKEKIKKGKYLEFDSLEQTQKEFFVREMFTPKDSEQVGLIDHIIDFSKKHDVNQDIMGTLEDLSKEGNFINKATHTAKAKAMRKNIIDLVSLGFTSDQSRDVIIQGESFNPIDLLDEKFGDKKRIEQINKKLDVSFKRNIITRDKLDYYNKTNGEIAEGTMVNLKQMDSDTLLERLNKFDVEDFAKRNNADVSQVQEILEKYKANADIYENKTLINPLLKKTYFDSKELTSIKYDTDEGVEFVPEDISIGKKIKQGEKVGSLKYPNGDIKPVINKRGEGFLRTMDEGKMLLEPTKHQTPFIKAIFGNAEKGMAISVDDTDLGMKFWDEFFGKKVGALGRFEEVKHAVFNFRYGSSLNKMIDVANGLGTKEQNKLANRLNKAKLGFNAKIQDGSLIIDGNPKAKGGYLKKFSKIFDEYKKNPAYKKSLEDESILRLFLSQGQHSDVYRSQGKFGELGNGIKINPRLIDSLVMKVGEDNGFVKEVNGKQVSIAEPLAKDFMDRFQIEQYDSGRLTEYGMAKQDGLNMNEVLKTSTTNEPSSDNFRVKNVTLDEFDDVKGLRDADALRDSVYKVNEKGIAETDIFRLDLGDISVTNNRTGDVQNVVDIPFLHSHVIGNKVVNSDAQVSVAKFISSVHNFNEGNFESIDHAQKLINTSYNKMLNQFDEEVTVGGATADKILSGRIDHSGRALGGGIITPSFVEGSDNMILKNDHFMSDDLIKKTEKGKQYFDVDFAGEDFFKELGVDFKTIGQDTQAMYPEEFEKYAESLKIKNINKIDDETYQKIGKMYASDKGIPATTFRDPTVLDGSLTATRLKFDPYLKGKAVYTTPWSGNERNADIDGDQQGVILNLDSEGHLRPKNHETNQVIDQMREAQSFENASKIDAIAEDYKKGENFATTKEEFDLGVLKKKNKNRLDKTKELTFDDIDINSNLSRNMQKMKTVNSSKAAKDGIGLISNANFFLRQSIYGAINESPEDSQVRNEIVKRFTNPTEQSIFDTKHEEIIEKTVGKDYSLAMSKMASDDKKTFKQGHEMMEKILKDKIYPGEENLETANSVMDSLKYAFSNKKVKENYNALSQKNNNDNRLSLTRQEKVLNDKINSHNPAVDFDYKEGDIVKNVFNEKNRLKDEVYKVNKIDRKNFNVELMNPSGETQTFTNPKGLNIQVLDKGVSLDKANESLIKKKKDTIISDSIRNMNDSIKKQKHHNRSKYFNQVQQLSPSKNTVENRRKIFDDVLKTDYYGNERSFAKDKVDQAFNNLETFSPTEQQAYAESYGDFFKDKLKVHDEFETKLQGFASKENIAINDSSVDKQKIKKHFQEKIANENINADDYQDRIKKHSINMERELKNAHGANSIGVSEQSDYSKSILRKFNEKIKSTDDIENIRNYGDELLADEYFKQTGTKVNKMKVFSDDLLEEGAKRITQEDAINSAKRQAMDMKLGRASKEAYPDKVLENVGRHFNQLNDFVKNTDKAKAATQAVENVTKNMTFKKAGIGALALLGAGAIINNIANQAPEGNNRRAMPYQSSGGFTMTNNAIIPNESYKNISDGKPTGNITVKAKSNNDIRINELQRMAKEATQSDLNVRLNDNQNELSDTWVKDKFIDMLG